MADVAEITGIEKAFGGEWLSKYQDSLKRNRVRRLDMTDTVKSEIIDYVKNKMKPESPALTIMIGTTTYDVLLAQTPEEIRIRELEFGKSVSFKWRNEWLSTIVSDKDIEKLQPNEYYVLVGKFSIKNKPNNKTYYNMSAHGLITMAEVAEHGKALANQKAEVDKKIEEFQEEE